MSLDYVSMNKMFFLLDFSFCFVKKTMNIYFFYALTAKESPSPADLMCKLVEFGFSSSTETRSFAEEIYAKVPHKKTGPSVSSLEFSCNSSLDCAFLPLLPLCCFGW